MQRFVEGRTGKVFQQGLIASMIHQVGTTKPGPAGPLPAAAGLRACGPGTRPLSAHLWTVERGARDGRHGEKLNPLFVPWRDSGLPPASSDAPRPQ